MKIEEVEGLEPGRPIDDAIKPAVEHIEKLEDQGRYRGMLFVYDEEEDIATMALFGYNDRLHIIKDADALAVAVREAK